MSSSAIKQEISNLEVAQMKSKYAKDFIKGNDIVLDIPKGIIKTIKVVENDFIIYLKEYSLKRNINFVLDNVNNKELIAHFANEGISLYSGKVYSALLTKNEIVKSFLS